MNTKFGEVSDFKFSKNKKRRMIFVKDYLN